MLLKFSAKISRFKFALLGTCLAALTGCVVGPGYYDGDVYVPGPDVAVFGGYSYGHVDVIARDRGYRSRAAANFPHPAPRPPAPHPAPPPHGGGPVHGHH